MVNKLTVNTPFGVKVEYYVRGERIWTEYLGTPQPTPKPEPPRRRFLQVAHHNLSFVAYLGRRKRPAVAA